MKMLQQALVKRHDSELITTYCVDFGLDNFGRTVARTDNSSYKKLAVQWLNDPDSYRDTITERKE